MFFYKKCDHNRNTAIEKQKFDMLVDSYGKDNLNMVAISLNLPYDSQKKYHLMTLKHLLIVFKDVLLRVLKVFKNT